MKIGSHGSVSLCAKRCRALPEKSLAALGLGFAP
jgi:hypothetical protein